ncbi:MAG: LLM class F420-dependent oxidoreductase [Chloroflexi bacterium]|nr:MAG: LLM class F420-dependent oxidoreductase [Chloroflexota bacterium]
MKIGVILPYEGGLPFADALEMTQRAEGLGFDSVWVPEAWGTDAISLLGALAARTERIRLGTGIVNVFSRTPTLLGQTAATLDLISNGRFILGLGTSGHQVVSGWHGMPFDRPLQRMRETVEIVRRVLRQERLGFEGEIFTLNQGLKLLARPVRPTVPIFLATLTPAGLRLTGEVADGWIPTLFSPEHLDLFRPELEAGARAAGRSLDSLEIAPYVPVLIDDDRSAARDAIRPWVALYVGGMGSRAKNFYNEVVQRYGFVEEARDIQELYLTGKKLEAIRRVPDTLVDSITIVGPPDYVRERIEAWASAGVTLLLASVQAKTQADRLRALEILAAAGSAVY